MNLDDPKLTAFALEELNEPERSTFARAVAASPEAQQFVDETRELGRALKNEFGAELKTEALASRIGGFRCSGERRFLIDIRDEPWFWSVGRPLATAASIAIFAILIAIVIASYQSRHDTNAEYADVQGEEKPSTTAPSEFAGPDNIPNPLRTDVVQHVERVVIGELNANPHLQDGELRLIEVINDAYRIQRLKQRLAVPVLSKKLYRGVASRRYELMFLDRKGQVVVSADFYHVPNLGFVLQPSKTGYERDGHYFPGRGNLLLPGDWKPDVNYSGYVIPFPDWSEAIGYSPGA